MALRGTGTLSTDGKAGADWAVRGEDPDAVILGVVEKSKGRGGGIRLPRTDVVQPCGQDFFGFFGVSGPAGFYSDGTAGFSVLVGFAFFFFAGGRDPKTLQILIDQSVNFLIFFKNLFKTNSYSINFFWTFGFPVLPL